MNWIQRHILTYLTLNATGRYSDMRPENVDGNLFLYHLDALITDGYVAKADKTYELSTKGRREAGILTVDTGKRREQPKICVMLVAQNEAGEHLLFKWHRQPFMGKVSLPYGKTHYGAPVTDMARRELNMKTSLDGSFEHLGDVYVKALVGDEVLNHMLLHVYRVTNWSGEVASTVPTGEAFWGDPADFDCEDFVPGMPEIFALIQESHGGSIPFTELVVQTT